MIQVEKQTSAVSVAPDGAVLGRLFHALDKAEISYCVQHGYEGYPQKTGSDVDCLMPATVLPTRLANVLHESRTELGAQVVQWWQGQAHFIVLAGRDEHGSPIFLQLHVSPGCELRRRPLYSGDEVLSQRRRRDTFWIPAARHEFGWYLSRKIDKGKLDDDQCRHLTSLYREDAAGCRQQIERLFGSGDLALRVATAAESGEWEPVRQNLTPLQTIQIQRATRRSLAGTIWNAVTGAARMAARFFKADRGLNVVVLGPDGSGKSSVVESVRQDLSPAFISTERRTFPPAILNRNAGTNSTPHAVKTRSWTSSVVRAVGYWLVYYTVGHYFTVHRAKSRGTLVLHDRHLVDCLVDPKRYRYGGPMGLLRLIWRMVRKPDLVILLDGPADIIQARKREVPLAETERQLREYRAVVQAMPNGRLVDATKPLADVINDVNQLILQHMAARAANRFGREVRA
jgi:thymidylate kinase